MIMIWNNGLDFSDRKYYFWDVGELSNKEATELITLVTDYEGTTKNNVIGFVCIDCILDKSYIQPMGPSLMEDFHWLDWNWNDVFPTSEVANRIEHLMKRLGVEKIPGLRKETNEQQR